MADIRALRHRIEKLEARKGGGFLLVTVKGAPRATDMNLSIAKLTDGFEVSQEPAEPPRDFLDRVRHIGRARGATQASVIIGEDQ